MSLKKPRKYLGNWNLKERIQEIPKSAYDALYKEFESYSAVSTGRKRWHQILRQEVKTIYPYEFALFCEHIGCTIHELIDEDVDLLRIYLRKQEEEQAAVAVELGLSKPKS